MSLLAPDRRYRVDRPTRSALDRGLQYLHTQQERDGSWDHSVETTAFAILATLSNGHTLQEGNYSPQMQKAIRYLLACQGVDGLISNPSNTRLGLKPTTTFSISAAPPKNCEPCTAHNLPRGARRSR